MICKFCGELMEDNHKFCPFCGKDPADSVASAQVAEIETAQEAATDVVVEKPKKKVWKLVAGIAAAIVALVVLSAVLLLAMGVELLPRPNDIFCKDSFTVSDEKAVKNGNKVVATIGDKVLTNAQLQLYYRAQVIELLNYYGSYISSIGLDYTKPLSENIHHHGTHEPQEEGCPEDERRTGSRQKDAGRTCQPDRDPWIPGTDGTYNRPSGRIQNSLQHVRNRVIFAQGDRRDSGHQRGDLKKPVQQGKNFAAKQDKGKRECLMTTIWKSL